MSTDDHFSRLLVQDEKNLKRLWADIEANRTHCDKHHEMLRETLGEEEHSRKEADQALRSSLDFLQQELAHSKLLLSDAIDKEAQSRETADAAMLAAAAALREDTETVHHALGRQITLLAEKLAGELGAIKQVAMEASAGHVKRNAANKDSIQAVEKQMDALIDRLACTQALLEDVKYTTAKENALVQQTFVDVKREARKEFLERQAAVTEVYRRLHMSREMVRHARTKVSTLISFSVKGFATDTCGALVTCRA
jgi:hypothetical protein